MTKGLGRSLFDPFPRPHLRLAVLFPPFPVTILCFNAPSELAGPSTPTTASQPASINTTSAPSGKWAEYFHCFRRSSLTVPSEWASLLPPGAF